MSDKLLEVISTRGEMSLGDFNTAFERLVTLKEDQDLVSSRRETLYGLDALGHCEKDWSRQRLFACRPVLARLPAAGCPKVVLTGARTAQIIATLRSFTQANPATTHLSIASQAVGLPSVITLETADEFTLTQWAAACGLPLSGNVPAAWALANVSGCLSDFKAKLNWKPDAPLNWRLRVFDPYARHFRRDDALEAVKLRSSSERLTEHTNPVTQQRTYRWTQNGSYAYVAGDWGRWLALAAFNEKSLLYDSRRQRLAVPAFVPLPRLLARAATLCSGQAASADKTQRQTVYESVPPVLADMIAVKCGQTCKPANLERESDRA